MTTSALEYFRGNIDLSEEEIRRISALASVKEFGRNEFILHQGQICRHKAFIAKGLVRISGTTNDGSEHILQFCPEHTWALDVESYDRQTPAQFSITAIEQSEVWLWNKQDFDFLLSDIPSLKAYAQQLISGNIYNSRQRLLSTLGGTPEEKYEDFVQTSPGLLARLPLHMIAAYLGVSLKTLTRIRHARAHR